MLTLHLTPHTYYMHCILATYIQTDYLLLILTRNQMKPYRATAYIALRVSVIAYLMLLFLHTQLALFTKHHGECSVLHLSLSDGLIVPLHTLRFYTISMPLDCVREQLYYGVPFVSKPFSTVGKTALT